MGGCLSRKENLKIKYIPGYEEKVWGKSVEKKPAVKKFHKWGITMSVIDEFIEECGGEEKLLGLTTREVTEKFLKPQMLGRHPEKGGSYAYWKRKFRSNRGVRDAEIYVVHAWDSLFLDVVDILRSYVAPMEKRDIVTLWFDMLCVNQCKEPKERKQNVRWFQSSFVAGMEEIGHVIVAVTPWYNPIVFTRAWCLWEINTAVTNVGCIRLEFALRPEEYALFKQAIVDESPLIVPYSFFKHVDAIALSHAKTYYQRHHNTIMRVCSNEDDKTELHEHEVNVRLRKLMKDWVVNEAKVIIGQQMENSAEEYDAKAALANIYRHSARTNDAIACLEEIFLHKKMELGYEGFWDVTDKTFHVSLEKLLHIADMLGSAYLELGQLDKALERYLDSLDKRLKYIGTDHPETAANILTLSVVYNNLNDYDSELTLFQNLLEIFTDELGEDHEYSILLLSNVGHLYYRLSQLKYEVHYNKGNNSGNHRFHIGMEDTAEGRAEFEKTKAEYLEKALDVLTEVYEIRAASIRRDHVETLYLLELIAEICTRLGRFMSARAKYMQHYLLMKEKFPGAETLHLPRNGVSSARERLQRNEVSCFKDPNVLDSWFNFAEAIRIQAEAIRLGDQKQKALELDNAAEEMELCLYARKKILGYAHADTIKTRDRLLDIWKNKRDYQKIAEYYRDAKEDKVRFLASAIVFDTTTSSANFDSESKIEAEAEVEAEDSYAELLMLSAKATG